MADDKPKNADFIGSVVSDAKNPPETRMLTGWFGDSGEEGYRRLYGDAELANYVDIPDDAILYSEPVRDSQPSGCVLVWIKRDAAVKQGGSASSRAARFLQGQVQQDFAAGAAGSLEKAGLRCVTEVPCGEPTGFTGQCTKQPDVGGAWPCVTAIPHCFEVTGFTGKCTHAPWPNPTRYIGCTYLHCPTNDLTHIPHICNIVASGMPGCAVVNPPQGGDPAQKAGAAEAEEKAVPATSIPGCGYTKTWGVCETHLLGCGYTKDCPPTIGCPEQFARGVEPQPTEYPLCMQARAGQAGAAAAQPASAICATAIGCDITVFCQTRFQPLCFPTLICPTQPQQCFPIPSPFCPVTRECPFGGGGGDPAQHAGFAAAARGAQVVVETNAPCSAVDACPSRFCNTQQPTALCTPDPQFCPTFCGPDCQTPQPACTSVNCLTKADPQCSPSNVFHDCTSIGSTCPTKLQPGCPTMDLKLCPTSPQFECTMFCTQIGPQCPGVTTTPLCNNPNVAARQAAQGGAAAACAAFTIRPTIWTQLGPTCPSHLLGCTQYGPQCRTYPRGDCTFFGCPPTPQFECTMFCTQNAPGCPPLTADIRCIQQVTTGGPQCPPASGFNCPSAFCQSIDCQSVACQPGGGQQQQAFARQAGGAVQTLATVCTQIVAQCPTYPNGDCTFFGCPHTQSGPGCPPTPATVCTQFPPCPTQPRGDCTFFGCQHTHSGPGCPPTPATVCTQVAPCPTHYIPCVSPGIDCTVMFCTHAGPGCPTPATVCTQFAPCPTLLTQLQCNPSAVDACPTRPCTQVIQCNPSAIDACPTRLGCPTQNPQQCPPASGFNCPSQIGCQSIACQSVACQPGGGGQQALAARQQWQAGAPVAGPLHSFAAYRCYTFFNPCNTAQMDCWFANLYY